jgi:hypothetical protein
VYRARDRSTVASIARLARGATAAVARRLLLATSMTTSIRRSSPALVLFAALGAMAGASHASELPSAVEHFVAGKHLYEAHLFRRALAEFESGYVASQLPGFLINMAQCHRQLGELDEALREYEHYLDYDSTSGAAREVREVVAELKRPLLPALPPAPAPPPAESPSLALASVPPPPEPRAARPFTYSGVALSGALLVTGAALEIATSQTFDQLRTTCGATVGGCSAVERGSFDREYQAATGVFIAAAITSAATIVAVVLEERARRARARRRAP